jgi:hypothetical protein
LLAFSIKLPLKLDEFITQGLEFSFGRVAVGVELFAVGGEGLELKRPFQR